MGTTTLSQIENSISQLSLDEQLWLMERLIKSIRENAMSDARNTMEDQLAAMANDSEIQKELQAIETEFSITEADGLGDT